MIGVICTAPLFYEGVAALLGVGAEVRRLPTCDWDSDSLLQGVRPDAVVVDSTDAAAQAEAYARRADVPLVHVRRGGGLDVLEAGQWHKGAPTGPSAVELRNVVMTSLFSARPSVRTPTTRGRRLIP